MAIDRNIKLLRDKARLIVESGVLDADNARTMLEMVDTRIEGLTLRQLQDMEEVLEAPIRMAMSKQQRGELREALEGTYGRASVGPLPETVAERVLKRGANKESGRRNGSSGFAE